MENITPEGIKIVSIRQGDVLGLDHAILDAKPLLNNQSFALLLPDVLALDNGSRSIDFSF